MLLTRQSAQKKGVSVTMMIRKEKQIRGRKRSDADVSNASPPYR
jgi:hypothetical protein